ncbi:hypothetical protein QBC39DRAFT_184480 [Podospora conica]|nr:hypothetical protein QBC39DRAFT_184480 [Schizothecium conicum]
MAVPKVQMYEATCASLFHASSWHPRFQWEPPRHSGLVWWQWTWACGVDCSGRWTVHDRGTPFCRHRPPIESQTRPKRPKGKREMESQETKLPTSLSHLDVPRMYTCYFVTLNANISPVAPIPTVYDPFALRPLLLLSLSSTSPLFLALALALTLTLASPSHNGIPCSTYGCSNPKIPSSAWRVAWRRRFPVPTVPCTASLGPHSISGSHARAYTYTPPAADHGVPNHASPSRPPPPPPSATYLSRLSRILFSLFSCSASFRLYFPHPPRPRAGPRGCRDWS